MQRKNKHIKNTAMQIVLSLYNGRLFSLKKEVNSDTSTNMDDPREHYAE